MCGPKPAAVLPHRAAEHHPGNPQPKTKIWHCSVTTFFSLFSINIDDIFLNHLSYAQKWLNCMADKVL